MKSVSPAELPAHRAFFTEFDRFGDPSKWSSESEKTASLLAVERRLKLLILTKAHVLVASSQLLESPLAHDLLLKHPRLLTSGAIISSIKLGHKSNYEFLEIKRNEDRERPFSPYHSAQAADVAHMIDNQGQSVRWPLEAMSDWFRNRLAGDLHDEQSLVRVALRREGVIVPPNLANDISAHASLSRGMVDKIAAAAHDQRLRDILKTYTDFIYYLSGAHATGSEGILPQENLVDFTLSELLGRRTRLSENEIFFKIFIDSVKATTSTIFPSDFLDSITIEDALDLRAIAVSEDFVEGYNTLQAKTKEAIAIRDPQKLVLLLTELDAFETALHQRFNEALDLELSRRLVKMRQKSAGTVLHAMTSLVIPVTHVQQATEEILVSGLRWSGHREIADAIEHKIHDGLKACESMMVKSGLIERQRLLDYVEAMKERYIQKLRQS